jgi:HEAT repeat protein
MRAAWLLLLLFAFGACKDRPDKVALSRIVIDAPPNFDTLVGAREAVRDELRRRLENDSTVTGFVRRPEATHNLAIRVYPPTSDNPEEEAGASFVPVEVKLTGLGNAPTYSVVTRGQVGSDLTALVQNGFDEGWPLLTRMRVLDRHGERELLAALNDSEPRVRLFAIERLGERKSQAAVKPLCALLRDDERADVTLRAVGALVAIGDPAAVRPLIDLTLRKDPQFVLQILFAIAALGGRDAEAFLVTLASGHPHPEVQRGAKDALAEMQRRRDAGL